MEIALRRNEFQPRHIRKLVRILDKGKREEFYGKFLAYGKARHNESRVEYGAYTESEKKDAKNALVDAHNSLKESLSLLDIREHESLEKRVLVLESRVERALLPAIVAWGCAVVSAFYLACVINAATDSMVLSVSAAIAIMGGSTAALIYAISRHSKAYSLMRKVDRLLSEIRSERDRLRIDAEVGNGYSEPSHVSTISNLPLLPKIAKKLIPESFEG